MFFRFSYTTVHFWDQTDFFMFLKELSFAHKGCIYLIKNREKNSNIVKYYYNLKQQFSILLYFKI